MGNRELDVLNASRKMAMEAVTNGIRTPKELREYFIDNGFQYQIPSRPTLEKLLRENGVDYVEGQWTKI